MGRDREEQSRSRMQRERGSVKFMSEVRVGLGPQGRIISQSQDISVLFLGLPLRSSRLITWPLGNSVFVSQGMSQRD